MHSKCFLERGLWALNPPLPPTPHPTPLPHPPQENKEKWLRSFASEAARLIEPRFGVRKIWVLMLSQMVAGSVTLVT